MSLFGQQNPQNPQNPPNPATGSFFRAPPQQTGLFSNPPAAAPQASRPTLSSMFGQSSTTAATAAPTQPQAASGLFGGSTATAPMARSGLFGAAGTTSQPQPAAGGLWGRTAIPTQPQPGVNLPGPAGFGTSAGPNLTASARGPTQAPPSGAYFDSLLAKSKKEADGEAASEALPSLQLGLGDLRQRLRKLGPHAQDRPLDGKAHYLLAASGVDPGAAVRDLGAFGGHAGRLDRPQGPSAGELDVETYLANLQTKTTLSMIADGLERSVRDFDSFLEDNVAMEWEAQRKRIYQHFGIKPREETAGSSTAPGREAGGGFGRSRRSRQQSSTPAPRAAQKSAFGRSGLQKSVIGTPSRIGPHASEFSDMESTADTVGSLNGVVVSADDPLLRDKQAKLAAKVQGLNDDRTLLNKPYPILSEIAAVEKETSDPHARHMVEACGAMMEIVGEDPKANPDVRGGTARARQFAKSYLDPNPNSQGSVELRKRILNGATRYLERQFFAEVDALIDKFPEEAALGGCPDVVSKIRAFIRLQIKRKDLDPETSRLQHIRGDGGDYLWVVIFYLLRSGFINEAVQYVNANQGHFNNLDRSFPSYIGSYAQSGDRRLKRPMQERCNNEYNQRARNAPENSMDPFRMACYKIIGRCDVNNRSLEGVHMDVSDWVWLQFALAREGDRSSEFANEMFGLAELQASMREIGLKHFPKSNSGDTTGSFGMFFFLQILSGMFEQAVAYLYSFSYVDAVHFAIALEYYGLLRASDPLASGNELLSHNTRGLPQINFARMLGYYTRDFRAANVSAAVDYLVLIFLNVDDVNNESDRQQAQLCHEALRELVLETREFSKLIGDIKPDGRRIKGIIEERGPLIGLDREQDFVKTISRQAAGFADDNGRTTDAVLLYHLAGDYDNVVAIVSRALSEAISLEIGEDPMRLIPVKPRVEGKEAEAEAVGSLSLAAIDDPVELARTMMTMYERDQMFRRGIGEANRVACSVLLQMSEIKTLVEDGKWAPCLDKIRQLDILPLTARGDPSVIRNYASKFSSLSQPVAINVPNLLMWTIICCTKQRERLMNGQFTGNETASRTLADELKQISVDLTTYTSQLRYRFPPYLHEALARASAD